MQYKHDVVKSVDDVTTLMMLVSLYHHNEKKLGPKFSKLYVFFEVQLIYHWTDYAVGMNLHTV